MTRDRGAVALVLHSHMPYVEGFGTWPSGEEWLWEAVATVYLPLLEIVDAPVTIGLTPVLCDQLETLPGEAGARLLSFLRDVRAPIHAEDAAGLERGGEPGLAAELRRAAGDYSGADERFRARGGDLIGGFGALERERGVELMASAASHAVLPLLATDAGRALQVATGTAAHRRRFGGFCGAFWSPECAYEPGLEALLADHGVRLFCVDQTDRHGLGAPEQLEPVVTEAGPVAVPIDWQTVRLVWDLDSGYPAHPAYRDYHRRTVHDLRPWTNGGGAYDHAAAERLADRHAEEFVRRAVARLDEHLEERGRPGLLCCALDTELLGHWWYEGPAWLRGVFAHARTHALRLTTLSEGIAGVEPVAGRPLAASTWGQPKDLSTWDAPHVADLAFGARRREVAVVEAAARAGAGPAVERAARELLGLQASDWAFMVTRGLAGPYPRERARGHADRIDLALAALKDSAPVPEPAVRNLAPGLDLSPLLAP